MRQVIRAQYRAVLKEKITEAELQKTADSCRLKMQKEMQKEHLLTGGIFRYEEQLFLYMEYITDTEIYASEQNTYTEQKYMEQLPQEWFPEMTPLLHTWPGKSRQRSWAYMYPVFWFDTPKSLDTWKRKEKPNKRCGRIAVLHPEKLFSYVCHHQAIVKEGLLTGDRYQMISLHENVLFSYFETPRDREQVNIRRSEDKSEEIKKWEAVDPESHFCHFPEAKGENFLIIETLVSAGEI